jgi:hypothetical protein
LGQNKPKKRWRSICFPERPLSCRLPGIVNALLAHNLTGEAIASARREILPLAGRFASALHRALPWLPEPDAASVARSIALYVAGRWPRLTRRRPPPTFSGGQSSRA